MTAPRPPGRGPAPPETPAFRTPWRAFLPLIASLLGLNACGTEEVPVREASSSAPLVEVIRSRSGRVPLAERSTGIVRARGQVAVRAEIDGRVREVLVRTGESVSRGQPLLRLDDAELREQLAQADAGHASAEADLRAANARLEEARSLAHRHRRLADEGVISRLELESLDARLQAARAEADAAQAGVAEAAALRSERAAALERSVVRSPIDGVVGRVLLEPGARATPDDDVAIVGDVGALVVDVPLTDAMLGRLRPGQPARLGAPSLEAPAEGVLARIPPFLDPGSFRAIAEIDVAPGSGLLPGMSVNVSILHGESATGELLPVSAAWEDPATGALGVFVVDAAPASDGLDEAVMRQARFRPVTLAGRDGETMAVEGLEPGALAVVMGQHLLDASAPSPVRVREATWERVTELQRLQREDLLEAFLAEQQRIARTGRVAPPDVDALREAAQATPPSLVD